MNNEITFKENDKETKYNILLNLENINNKNYIIYTKKEKQGKNIICYANEYIIKNNNYILKNIKKEELLLLEGIINSIKERKED